MSSGEFPYHLNLNHDFCFYLLALCLFFTLYPSARNLLSNLYTFIGIHDHDPNPKNLKRIEAATLRLIG